MRNGQVTNVLDNTRGGASLNAMGTRSVRGWIAAAICVWAILGASGPAGAQPEPAITVRQGEEFEVTIYPIVRPGAAEDFYNYSTFDYNSRTSLELPRHSLLFFYRDARTGQLSLIILNNAPNAGSGGKTRLDLQGLPPAATLTLRDDSSDQYSFAPPTARFEWRWASGHTDGLVINDLRDSFTLTVKPTFESGIIQWKLLTQKSEGGPAEYVPLPSLTEPLTLSVGMVPERRPPQEPGVLQAAFTISPDPAQVGIPARFDATLSTGDIVQYEWDFDGDGTFDARTSDPAISHTYDGAGTFSVTLRVTDSDGNRSTVSRGLEVIGAKSRAQRTISTPQTQPGSLFRVTLDLTVGVPSNGLGVEERLPSGWIIEPVRNDGAVFKFTGASAQWIFPTLLKVGETKRIIYDVRLPLAKEISAPLPARFSLAGSVQSVSPAYTVPIAGESEVEIVSCLSAPVAIAHLDLMRNSVDLKRSETVSREQLDRALTFWQNGTAVPGMCNAQLTVSELYRVMQHQLLGIPVDTSLPAIPEDETVVSATRTITTPLPGDRLYLPAEGGNVFQVEVTIRAERELAGLILMEDLPARWRVAHRAPASAVFKAEAVEWALPERIPAGETRQVRYEVTLPPDAEPGAVALTGDVDISLLPFLIPVRGENALEVTECLSIPLAIAHLNVETGEIDLSLDNKVNREQVDAAFLLWFEDEAVPGTCELKLDLATLQDLIDLMIVGEPVGP